MNKKQKQDQIGEGTNHVKGEGKEQCDHKSYLRGGGGDQTGSMVKPQSRFVVCCVQQMYRASIILLYERGWVPLLGPMNIFHASCD